MQRLRQAATLLLLTSLVLPGAAQQLDANNWGKGTPGVTLLTHEEPRQKAKHGTFLWYNLLGQGFPDGVVYSLWVWPLGKSPQLILKGVSFDHRGLLVCSGKPGFCSGAGANDPVNLKSTAALGEMKRMAVVSDDGKVAAFADALPFPIEASDKSCKLSVVRMSPLADVVMARGSGLKPNAPLTVTSGYGGEVASAKATASAEGTWQQVLTGPGAKQLKGEASISVSDASCKISVAFAYGPGTDIPQ